MIPTIKRKRTLYSIEYPESDTIKIGWSIEDNYPHEGTYITLTKLEVEKMVKEFNKNNKTYELH